MDEYYTILEVQRNASIAEIKAAKVRLLQMWHPDSYQRNPELARIAEERTKLINDAYDKIAAYLKTGQQPRTHYKKTYSSNYYQSNTQTENAHATERERKQREEAERERIAKELAAEQDRSAREKAKQEAIRRTHRKKVIKVCLAAAIGVFIISASLFLKTGGSVEVPKRTPSDYQVRIDEPGSSPTFAGTWQGNISGLPFELQIWHDDIQWKATISISGKTENLQVLGLKRNPETVYLYRPADVAHISMSVVKGNMNLAYLDSGTVRNVTLKRVR